MKQAQELKMVECGGSPYEIGRQWGEGCKESILRIAENISQSMADFYQASKEEAVANAMKFLPVVKEYDPYLVEIMRGQAEATGLAFEEIFTQKCFNELCFHFSSINNTGGDNSGNSASGLCTSFAAAGPATREGNTILGQNIDFIPGNPVDFLKIHHENGVSQFVLSFSNSSEFILSSAGFGMCANATIGKGFAMNIPVGCYLPRVMREHNAPAAMELLRQAARGLGYYHLADRDGYMAGIESIHNDFAMLNPEKGLLLHSNHYLTEGFQDEDTAMMLQPDSYPRLERIRDLMQRHYGHIGVETVMEILADHAGHPDSICRHVNPAAPISSATLVSFIMVPAENVLYLTAGPPCEYEYRRYRL